jgi:hypothetical protein
VSSLRLIIGGMARFTSTPLTRRSFLVWGRENCPNGEFPIGQTRADYPSRVEPELITKFLPVCLLVSFNAQIDESEDESMFSG